MIAKTFLCRSVLGIALAILPGISPSASASLPKSTEEMLKKLKLESADGDLSVAAGSLRCQLHRPDEFYRRSSEIEPM